MAGGFGFQKYPQQGTPNAEAIGMALMRGGMGEASGPAAPQGMPAGGGLAPMATPSYGAGQDAAADPGAAMRAEGAYRMTGAGQIGDGGADPDEHGHSTNAMNIALGEALTRMGSGYRTNPNPYKDRAGHMQRLMQLGLSETEARLLAETGGV